MYSNEEQYQIHKSYKSYSSDKMQIRKTSKKTHNYKFNSTKWIAYCATGLCAAYILSNTTMQSKSNIQHIPATHATVKLNNHIGNVDTIDSSVQLDSIMPAHEHSARHMNIIRSDNQITGHIVNLTDQRLVMLNENEINERALQNVESTEALQTIEDMSCVECMLSPIRKIHHVSMLEDISPIRAEQDTREIQEISAIYAAQEPSGFMNSYSLHTNLARSPVGDFVIDLVPLSIDNSRSASAGVISMRNSANVSPVMSHDDTDLLRSLSSMTVDAATEIGRYTDISMTSSQSPVLSPALSICTCQTHTESKYTTHLNNTSAFSGYTTIQDLTISANVSMHSNNNASSQQSKQDFLERFIAYTRFKAPYNANNHFSDQSSDLQMHIAELKTFIEKRFIDSSSVCYMRVLMELLNNTINIDQAKYMIELYEHDAIHVTNNAQKLSDLLELCMQATDNDQRLFYEHMINDFTLDKLTYKKAQEFLLKIAEIHSKYQMQKPEKYRKKLFEIMEKYDDHVNNQDKSIMNQMKKIMHRLKNSAKGQPSVRAQYIEMQDRSTVSSDTMSSMSISDRTSDSGTSVSNWSDRMSNDSLNVSFSTEPFSRSANIRTRASTFWSRGKAGVTELLNNLQTKQIHNDNDLSEPFLVMREKEDMIEHHEPY